MTVTPQGWKPFREWACQKEYDHWIRWSKTKYEANWNRRQLSKMIREWERGKNTQHRLYPLLVQKWSETLLATEIVQYCEP